jgi:isocitrate dehydrogenase (NAD+)
MLNVFQDTAGMISDRKVDTLRFLILPGDGIGPEISAAARRVLAAVEENLALALCFEEAEIGFSALAARRFPTRAGTGREMRTALSWARSLTNEYPPRVDGGLNSSGELRIRFDPFANIRLAKTHEGLPHTSRTPFVQENTEDFYANRSMFLRPGEFMPTPDRRPAPEIETLAHRQSR